MADVVYALCAATSVLCAFLLMRGHRESRSGLLFWSAVCFFGLALNNVVMFVDLVVVPSIDLSLWRDGTALLGMGLLVFGLVWESV